LSDTQKSSMGSGFVCASQKTAGRESQSLGIDRPVEAKLLANQLTGWV